MKGVARSLTTCLLCVLVGLAELAGGERPASGDAFDADIAEQFLGTAKKAAALRAARRSGTPLMVLLTQDGCGACQWLKATINNGTAVRSLLPSFTVVHAHKLGQWKHWCDESDCPMPQTLWFAPGERHRLLVHGTNSEFPHFFHDEETLEWGMRKVLEIVASGERWDGYTESARQQAIEKLGWASAESVDSTEDGAEGEREVEVAEGREL